MNERASISIAYVLGHYEVMLFHCDGAQSNPVWASTVEQAESQADKWQKRYRYPVERNYIWQQQISKAVAEANYEREIRRKEREFALATRAGDE